jgi:DNA ligase-1
MNKPWEVIAELEADNSRLAKEEIVGREAAAGNTEFFEGARLALNSMITFGLKQIPEKKDADGAGLDWADFTFVVERLVDRTLTGNAARDTVVELINQSTQQQWNGWYRRILIKDLRCGVSEKTINKMVGEEYAIPVFSCQLAHDSANHETKVSGEKLIEVKLDGVRVLTIVYPDGRVSQFSRNGKELVNFPHIVEQLSQVAAGFNIPMVLDGEVMSSSFQDLMKQVHRKDNVATNDAVLNLFDILPLEDFEAGISNVPQQLRSETLIGWHTTHTGQLPNVTVLHHELVDLDHPDGQARFRAINARAIAGGYEGIMIKDPDAVYECKRSVAWLKLKPFIEVSLDVVDFEEGTGRNAGRLGAIICEGEDDGCRIRVNVGSGFSDANRTDYWMDRSAIKGHVAEIRADAITKNQDGTYSLRFPRFLRFRGFAPGEKI